MSTAAGATGGHGSSPRNGSDFPLPSNCALLLKNTYRGDPNRRRSAWGELLTALQPLIKRVAGAVLRDQAGVQIDLEDFASDVTAGFWKSYGATRTQVPKNKRLTSERVVPILRAIAANKRAAHFARLARESGGESGVDPDRVQRTSPSASQWTRGRELASALKFLLNRELGAKNRKVFEMRAVHDLKTEEIIRVLRLKCTPDSLRKDIQRMRRKLRKVISPEMLSWMSGPRLLARKVARPDKPE